MGNPWRSTEINGNPWKSIGNRCEIRQKSMELPLKSMEIHGRDIHGKAMDIHLEIDVGNPWVIDGNPSDSGYGSNGRGYPAPFVKTPVVPPKRTGVSYKNSRQLRFHWKQHVYGASAARASQLVWEGRVLHDWHSFLKSRLRRGVKRRSY